MSRLATAAAISEACTKAWKALAEDRQSVKKGPRTSFELTGKGVETRKQGCWGRGGLGWEVGKGGIGLRVGGRRRGVGPGRSGPRRCFLESFYRLLVSVNF
eukprot:3339242-Rhodomonas_salina.2